LFGGGIIWKPSGARACTCAAGAQAYAEEKAEQEYQRQTHEKEEENKQMRIRVKRIIGKSGIGMRFLTRTFQTFKIETPLQAKIIAATSEYATNFAKRLPKRGQPLCGRNGFVISGSVGTGKTHIAAAIANHLLRLGTAVICMNERSLLGKIRSTYSGQDSSSGGLNESEILNTLLHVPLLIIDDLGKEKASEWTLATLYAIIDGRYENAMPLIITTNYDMQNLINKITPTGKDKGAATAIIDRLHEMCETITMNGASWRRK